MESFVLALALVVLASGKYDPAKEAKEYPYIVSIHKNSERRNYLCAGSLIATAWVLTTESCLTQQAFIIRYGDMITKYNGTYSRILQRIHRRNSRSFHYVLASKVNPRTNNIALALIEEIPVTTQVAQLSGIDYITLIGYRVTYFEFGFLPVYKAKTLASSEDLTFFSGLRTARRKKRDTINESDSEELHTSPDIKVLRKGVGIVTECEYRDNPGPNICVASKCFDFSAADPTQSYVAPDYGAPLVYDERVVGVTTDVDNSVYTSVSPHLNWILQYIERKNAMKS